MSYCYEEDDSSENSEKNENQLSTQFYMQLLKMENQLASGVYNLEIVNNSIASYAKCVEYFDSISDPIANYFKEKIQATLTSQRTLMQLLNCQANGEESNVQRDSIIETNQSSVRRKQDSFLSQDEEEEAQQQRLMTQEHFEDDENDDKSNNNNQGGTGGSGKQQGMRLGLVRMQEELEQRKQQREQENNPEELRKIQTIRARQRQMMFEVQKNVHQINNNNEGNNYLTGATLNTQHSNEGEEQKTNIKNTNEIFQDQEHIEKEQEEIVEKEMVDQQVNLEQRLLLRKQNMLKKKEEKKNKERIAKEEAVLLQEEEEKLRIKEENEKKQQEQNSNLDSIDLDINRNRQTSVVFNNNIGKQRGNTISNQFYGEKSGPIRNVSDIGSNPDTGSVIHKTSFQNMDDESKLEEEEAYDKVEIEEQIKQFNKELLNNGLPEDLQKQLRQASDLNDLDEKTLQKMDQYIQQFEQKAQTAKFTKSLNQHDLQDLLNKGRDLQISDQKNKTTSKQSLKQMQQQLMSGNKVVNNPLLQNSGEKSSSSKKKKLNSRNLSVQFVDTRSLSLADGNLKSLANVMVPDFDSVVINKKKSTDEK